MAVLLRGASLPKPGYNRATSTYPMEQRPIPQELFLARNVKSGDPLLEPELA
jgi:hypothetical protein